MMRQSISLGELMGYLDERPGTFPGPDRDSIVSAANERLRKGGELDGSFLIDQVGKDRTIGLFERFGL